MNSFQKKNLAIDALASNNHDLGKFFNLDGFEKIENTSLLDARSGW